MDYRKALERAVVHIENHLGDSLKVEDVAKAAGDSYYHLNRQFMAVLGEGLGSYIKSAGWPKQPSGFSTATKR